MRTEHQPDSKVERLRTYGALNRNPERVTEGFFTECEFCDPRDLVQVKYEMLRLVFADERTVKEAARVFGFSRPSFYKAQSAFNREGLPGLVPKKRGPRGGHKITGEVMEFIKEVYEEYPSMSIQEIMGFVKDRFDVTVHRRTMERTVARLKKKPREHRREQSGSV